MIPILIVAIISGLLTYLTVLLVHNSIKNSNSVPVSNNYVYVDQSGRFQEVRVPKNDSDVFVTTTNRKVSIGDRVTNRKICKLVVGPVVGIIAGKDYQHFGTEWAKHYPKWKQGRLVAIDVGYTNENGDRVFFYPEDDILSLEEAAKDLVV